MKGPLVQIVVPVHNREILICETLDSVLDQTYDNYLIWVSDDASTDNTVAVLERYVATYPEKIRLLRSDNRLGISGNFNRLLDAIQPTGYIAFLDSDDIWLPTKLETQVRYMENHPEIDLSFHDVEIFDSESVLGRVSEIIGRGRGRLEGGKPAQLFDLRLGMSQSSKMYRWNRIKTVRKDLRLTQGEDFLFDVDALANGGEFGAINEVLGRYRRHGGNFSRKSNSVQQSTEEMLIALAIIEARYPLLVRASLKKRNSVYVLDIVRSVRGGMDDRGRLMALNAWGRLTLKPFAVWVLYRYVDRYSDRVKKVPWLSNLIGRHIYR